VKLVSSSTSRPGQEAGAQIHTGRHDRRRVCEARASCSGGRCAVCWVTPLVLHLTHEAAQSFQPLRLWVIHHLNLGSFDLLLKLLMVLHLIVAHSTHARSRSLDVQQTSVMMNFIMMPDCQDDDNTWLWSLVFCARRASSGVSATTVAVVFG